MLPTLINFVFFILHWLLQAVIWIVIANAIVSWLVAFEVINMRNRMARQIVSLLDRMTRPLLWPFRRVIPTLGGIDISPVVLIVLLQAIDVVVLPALGNWLLDLVH
jgi:YggT family protein